MMTKISVIVPIYNSDKIARTLAALERQTIRDTEWEILLVGPDDLGYLKDLDQRVSIPFRHLDGMPPYSPAQNRNVGMGAAFGEILCFTDGDCAPNSDWLARLRAFYEDFAVDVVGGGVTFQAETYWAYCDNLSWFSSFLWTRPAGEREHLPTLNLSLRRRVFDAVGGIDEKFPLPAGEDTEWTSRMRTHGYTLHFEPRAIVHHMPQRTTVAALWHHGYNFGRYSPKHGMISSPQQTTITERFLPRHPWILAVLSPVLALAATAKIIVQEKGSFKALLAIPGIWLSKMAWCVGAIDALRAGRHDSH